MSRTEQWAFVKKYWPGLVLFTLSYMVLTAVRDFRDTFQIEIWEELYPLADGQVTDAFVFIVTEIPVAFAVLISLAFLNVIKNHRLSMLVQHAVILSGLCIMLGSQILFKAGYISGVIWYIAIGVGMYLAYAPVGAMYYDRLMGALREEGTAVFMMNFSDTFGYVGTVALILYQSFSKPDASSSLQYEQFFSTFLLYGTSFCIAATALTMCFWHHKSRD